MPTTTPDVRQAYPADVLITLADYARRHELGHRTVQRYLEQDRLPGAVKDADGRWLVPRDAQVTAKAATSVVRQAQREVAAPAAPDVRQAFPLGMLLTLDEAALLLRTTPGGVRRLAEHPGTPYVLGPFGPRGALRVFLAS